MSEHEVPSISELKGAKKETVVNDGLIRTINAVARNFSDETNLIDLYITKLPTAYDSNPQIKRNEPPAEWEKLLDKLGAENYNKKAQLIKMIGAALKAGYGTVGSIRSTSFDTLVIGRQPRTFFNSSPRDSQTTLSLEPITSSFLKGIFDNKPQAP